MRRRLAIMLGAVGLLTLGVVLGWADAVDGPVGAAAASESPFWGWITWLGDTVVLAGAAAAAVLLLWLLRGRTEATLMAGLTGVAWCVIWGLKHLIGRPRPESALDPSSPAFPSGHTLGTTAVYVGMAVLAGPERKPLLAAAAIALLVGWSRLALGEHHLTDVLAGWAVGAALVMAVHGLRSSIRAKQDAARHEADPLPPAPPGSP